MKEPIYSAKQYVLLLLEDNILFHRKKEDNNLSISFKVGKQHGEVDIDEYACT